MDPVVLVGARETCLRLTTSVETGGVVRDTGVRVPTWKRVPDTSGLVDIVALLLGSLVCPDDTPNGFHCLYFSRNI